VKDSVAVFRWTSFAAAAVGDADLDRALVLRYASDAMVRSDISQGLERRAAPLPLAPLEARFEEAEDPEERCALLSLAATIPTAPARALLERVARAPAGEEFGADRVRAAALEGVLSGFAASARPLALEMVADEQHGPAALAFIVRTGGAADLPLALGVIRERVAEEDAALVAVAFEGVAKWGDEKLKRETFLAALRSGGARARGALGAFASVGGPDVAVEVRRLARRAEEQAVRLAAVERLLADPPALDQRGRDPAIPCLIAALDEVYVAPEGPPAFANLLSLGLAGTLDSLTKKWDRDAFDATIAAVARGLAARAGGGADFGTSHEAWVDWALAHGYTVGGESPITRLFAPSTERRRRAFEDAARLAGFAGRDDLVKRTPALSGARDPEVALALARMLVEKGFLEDDE
jgi:hypothetical protein